MAWNQPGNNKNKDPWGKKPANGKENVDIDKFLRDIQNKITSLFGKSDQSNGGEPSGKENLLWRWIIGLIVALWFISGLYIVKPAEKAVVLRLGKYVKTVDEGPHWAPSLLDRVYNVDIAIQYRIKDAKAFFFNVVDPIATLQESTASALRQVIGNTTLDQVLTSGREDVRANVQIQLSDILNSYGTGIQVVDVALQPAKPPEEVKEAFDNAIKAEQEREQIVNQARGYQEKVIPEAQGQAQRLLAGARAYRAQVVLNAQGETARFLAMLPEYHRSPSVMRERLYIATVESVLTKTSKLFLDINKGNQLFLNVPIDKMLGDIGDVDNPDDSNADINTSSDDKQNVAALAAASSNSNTGGSYFDSSTSSSYLSNEGSQ
jgi:membrane protease subunit HflK